MPINNGIGKGKRSWDWKSFQTDKTTSYYPTGHWIGLGRDEEDEDEDETTATVTTVESAAPPPTTNAWGCATTSTKISKAVGLAEIQEQQEEEKKRRPVPPSSLSSRNKGGKYVPPGARRAATASGWQSVGHHQSMPMPMNNGEDNNRTIRVAGLTDGTTEVDLEVLCRPFGRISRIHVVKDRETSKPRGFAFVTFMESYMASQAKEKLDGHGYDHRILHVDWAKSREENNSNRPSYSSSLYRTGYGKALPQSFQGSSNALPAVKGGTSCDALNTPASRKKPRCAVCTRPLLFAATHICSRCSEKKS